MPIVVFGDFEWDGDKARANWRKHGVTFEEAITALADPRALEAPDLLHRERHMTIGLSVMHRVLFVVSYGSPLARPHAHHWRSEGLADTTEKV
jgi:hypothetical protein